MRELAEMVRWLFGMVGDWAVHSEDTWDLVLEGYYMSCTVKQP